MTAKGKQPELIRWNTLEILAALAERYKQPEYAFLSEVPNSTGGATRTADAIAMSLWRSRGYYVTGFEVKASRGDWLREKRNPAKAEIIARYCDFWYIVTGAADIVQDGELPPTWGLMIPRGNKLVIKVEAPRLKPEPISPAFLAAIMRKAHNSVTDRVQVEIEVNRAKEAEFKRGLKVGEDRTQGQIASLRHQVDTLTQSIKEFEEASGIWIKQYGGRRMGEAVKFVLNGGIATMKHELEQIRARAKQLFIAAEANLELAEASEADLATISCAAQPLVVTESLFGVKGE
jgi:hypothetical protein